MKIRINGYLRMHIKNFLVIFVLLISFNVFAQNFNEGLAASRAGDHTKAYQIYQALAEKGDARAMVALSYAYQSGQGTEKNEVESAKWAEKSANTGLMQGEFIWGSILVSGRGVTKNISEGMRYLISASDKGQSQASHILAGIYYKGEDRPKDYSKALEFAKKSAAGGEGLAFFMIADMYEKGNGVPKDINEAIKYCKLALDRIKPTQIATSNTTGDKKPWREVIEQKLKNLEVIKDLPESESEKKLRFEKEKIDQKNQREKDAQRLIEERKQKAEEDRKKLEAEKIKKSEEKRLGDERLRLEQESRKREVENKKRLAEQEKLRQQEELKKLREGDGSEEDLICKRNGLKPQTPSYVECKIKVRISLDEKKRLEIDHQNKLEQDRLAKIDYERRLQEHRAAKERQDLIMQEKQVERQKECATRQMICGLNNIAKRLNKDCDAAYDRCVAGVLEPPEPPPPPRPPNYHCQPIPGQIPDPVSGAVPMDCRSY